MALTIKKDRTSFPALVNDFFDGDQWFPEFFNFDNAFLKKMDLNARMPSANIIETDKGYRIELAAPGLEKKDFHIAFENGYLNIKSEKQEENKEEKEDYKRREFRYSSFSRSFKMPDNALTDNIDAKYENGVLLLNIPKKEPLKENPKKEITVK
jgi:HSP20 family protein